MAQQASFSVADAERIGRAVRKVEGGNRDSPGLSFGFRDYAEPGTGGSPINIGTYGTAGAQWEKGQVSTVHEYDVVATEGGGYTIEPKYADGLPVTVSVLNLFVTIPPNYDTVRYCAYSVVGEVRILLVAEC